MIKNSIKESDIDAKGDCPICMESFEAGENGDKKPVVDLKCGSEENPHVFHQECLAAWIDIGNTNCPLCRASIGCANAV